MDSRSPAADRPNSIPPSDENTRFEASGPGRRKEAICIGANLPSWRHAARRRNNPLRASGAAASAEKGWRRAVATSSRLEGVRRQRADRPSTAGRMRSTLGRGRDHFAAGRREGRCHDGWITRRLPRRCGRRRRRCTWRDDVVELGAWVEGRTTEGCAMSNAAAGEDEQTNAAPHAGAAVRPPAAAPSASRSGAGILAPKRRQRLSPLGH
jgi:hypothetical protein